MPTDLFFSNTMLPDLANSVQRGKAAFFAKAQFPDAFTSDKSWMDDHNSFAETLKKASQDRNRTSGHRTAYQRKSIDRQTFKPADKHERRPNPAAEREDRDAETISDSENCRSHETDERSIRRRFSLFMELLESLGLLDSSGGTGFNVENMAENGAETPDELSARLAEIKSLLSSESSTELEGLRQLIAEALQAAKSSQTIGNSADGPLPEQAAKIAELAQLLKGMSSDHGNRNRNEAGHEAQSSSGDKSAETVSAMNRIAAELANSAGVADPSKSAESSEAASLKDNAADRATSVDGQGTDAGENAKEASASELLPEDSRTQEEAETPDKTGSSGRNGHQSTNSAALGRGAHPGDEPVQLNRHADESAQVSKAIDDAHGAKNSAREERHGNGTEQETPPNQGSSEVPKIIKDAQAIKDNPMKTGAAFSDDFGAKLNNSDGSTNYNGLFNSESQNTEKAFANISGSKEPEAGQFALKTQTLDQIVQKAVIHLKNGQHEARIDLKPDYLGHVRMQVITENHQVTVKILTEFSFVKDLIENNAHQLKADMQQQGLNVDKLEVSVSNGRDDRADSQGRGERLNRRRQFSGHGDAGHLEEDVRMQTGPTRRPAANASAVDYFA